MHNALGNLLALFAQGQLSKAEARAVAANKWVSGAAPVADLPAFDAELIKLAHERHSGEYVERVAKRSWPEIEEILKSPHLDFATKQEIRRHPDTLAARQAFKLATFGAHPSDQARMYRAFAKAATFPARGGAGGKGITLSMAKSLRDRWLKSWPEVATWIRAVDPARPGCDNPVIVGPFAFEPAPKVYETAADVKVDFGFTPIDFDKMKKDLSVAIRKAAGADPTRRGIQRQRRGTVARASPTTGKKRGKRARRPARS